MAEKLEDHWLQIDKISGSNQNEIEAEDVQKRLKAHLKKFNESAEQVENAEFTEAVLPEPLSSIDTYA